MLWLRSRASHVRPPSSERYRAFFGGSASINAYTTFGFDGATVTATRPHGLVGSPFALFSSSSVQEAPPSVLLKSPLPLGALEPSPPERNVQPLRRKSHMPAYKGLGLDGSIDSIEHPVDAVAPFSTFAHVLPPSGRLQTPPASLSLHSCPGQQTDT